MGASLLRKVVSESTRSTGQEVAAITRKVGNINITTPVPKAAEIDSPYVGGSRITPSMRKWHAPQSSGDTQFDKATQLTLIGRSQDAYRNILIARAIISRYTSYVIGPGLKLQSQVDSKVLGISKEKAKEIERKIEKRFSNLAKTTAFDYYDKLNLYEMQALAFQSRKVDGDLIINTPSKTGRPRRGQLSLSAQLIGAEQLSNPWYNIDDKRFRNGVEHDSIGRPIAFHIQENHPSDIHRYGLEQSWFRLPRYGRLSFKERVFHSMQSERIGQSRGVPSLAVVMQKLKELDSYGIAELTSANVSAKATGAITTPNGDGLPFGTDATNYDRRQNEIAMGNGTIFELLPGEDIKFFNPARPNANYEPFVLAALREIGAATGLPVEFLCLHFTSSYTAARAALNQAKTVIDIEREYEINKIWTPFYLLYLDEMIMRREIELPDLDDPMRYDALAGHTWHGPEMGSVDEVKDILAARARIELKISNRKIEAKRLGIGDYDEIWSQLLKEETEIQDSGLLLGNSPEVTDALIEADAKKQVAETNKESNIEVAEKKKQEVEQGGTNLEPALA